MGAGHEVESNPKPTSHLDINNKIGGGGEAFSYYEKLHFSE